VYDENVSDRDEKYRNTYDNAVLYNDELYAKVIAEFKRRSPENSSIFFTSDHGEMLANGKYGHTFLDVGVGEVPAMYYSLGTPNDEALKKFNQAKYITHYDIAKMILSKMGLELINKNEKPREFFINGPSIFQTCRFIKGSETKDGKLVMSENLDSSYWKNTDKSTK
jgi:glucan phosphoethanolaminetransferase (alkaline phosphatase superfamily)